MPDANRLRKWIGRLGGEGYCGSAARDRAIIRLQAAGADEVFPLVIPMLNDSDGEVRCRACEAILWTNVTRGIPLVLPLLRDPEAYVRLCVCELLYVFGDERMMGPLVDVLQSDPDPQVRGTAAGILGAIGSPEAIPALTEAMESDHERDMHGHSPSDCAASALDQMLGTDETCAHLPDGLCALTDEEPDLERLERLAEETYDCHGERTAAPDHWDLEQPGNHETG